MPEGPEIRLAAEQLQRALVGELVESVFFHFPQLKPFEARLEGCKVEAIETRGKAMLTRFDNGLAMYSHNELHGRWYVGTRGRQPRTRRRLVVGLHTARNSALLYSANKVNILDEHGVKTHRFLNSLGPDILAPGLTWRDIVERLCLPQFSSRPLARLYLDQQFIAGIGNYLRSEILYFSGLHYGARPMDLSPAQRERLARQSLAITKRAYHTQGTTNARARIHARQAQGESRRRNLRHAVFDRASRPCDACGTPIVRVDIDFRRLYYCPTCQPAA